jgi:DNA primase large subunit
MDNELVRAIARRVFEQSSNINNYVMLEGLIRRFVELNPDADPESIDWSAVWDDTLSYDELIQAYREQYPMYRWDDKGRSEDAYNGDRVKDIASEIATKLDAEDFDKLIAELQKIKEEVLEDVRRVEAETPVIEPQPQPVEQPTAPVQPPEKPTGVGIKPSLHLFAKYPFLKPALPLLKTYHITNLPQEVRARAQERVLEAIERGEKGVLPKLDNPWVELLSFALSRALVLYVDDDWLRRRWALAEAARVERLLHGESDEVLLYVINDLGLQVKIADGKWIMHFSQYLHLSRRLGTEPRWKLVNRLMEKGLVSLTRPEVIRLVREWLYDSFTQTKPVPVNWHPEEARVIKEALQKRAAKTVAPAPTTAWAPCMVALRNRVADAGHFGLFALAAYMAQKGYEVNEIVDVLRVRSDFDERIARYQVEHIAGQRGSRVKYRPPSCMSMKTHGLCIDNGRQCPYSIKNPLQYRQPTGSAGPK